MNVSTYTHRDYSGGLNDSASASQIKRNEASLLYNWDITYEGQLNKRLGLTQTGDDMGSNAVLGLHTYIRTNGNKDLVCLEGTTLRYLNSTTWDSLDTGFTTGLRTSFETCPLNDKLYIVNGTENTHSWDRASTTNNSCLTDLTDAVPTGKIIKWHKNHMFVINNVKWGGNSYPNRIAWSALGDPDTWDTTNDFIDLPGGGRGITFGDLGDALVIFKERSIMFLSGWGDSDWRITASASNVANIDEAVGCIAPQGVTRVGNELWFIDDEGMIRRLYQTDFDAFRKDIVSTKIQGTLSGLNKSQVARAVAWTYNDKVYFAIPTGSSTTNNLVLVYDLIASKRTGEEAWTTYTGWSISCATHYPTAQAIDLYLGNDGADGLVYKHSGYSDDGVAIDSRWDGKDDDFDKADSYKRYLFGYITGTASTDIDVAVHASVDGAAFADLGDLNLADDGTELGPTGTATTGPTGTWILGGNSVGEFKYYFTSGGGTPTGKSVKMSIRHAVDAEGPVVNTFTVHFKQRGVR